MTSSYLRATIFSRNFGRKNFKVLLVVFWLSMLVTAAETQVPSGTCSIPSDTDIESRFHLSPWLGRGGCIRRSGGTEATCKAVLQSVLSGLAKLRETEYAAAASLLTLLPTIGTLFGPPTSEMWKLKSAVPFAGALAMGLSFGAAFRPVNAEGYDNAAGNADYTISSHGLQSQLAGDRIDTQGTEDPLRDLLVDKIRERVGRQDSVQLPRKTMVAGLAVMFILFAVAHAAMALVQQGAIITLMCSLPFWMHPWYFLVTYATWAEDRACTPFKKTYRLYVSSLPCGVEISGGQSISEHFRYCAGTENALTHLNTMEPGRLQLVGSRLQAHAANSVMVMVSIIGDHTSESLNKRVSQVLSVTILITATAFFASVTLLPMVMAYVLLVSTLAAGIFGRVLARGIVGHVERLERVIHLSFKNESEAHHAIADILSLKSDDGSPFQVEIKGHILVDGRRVAHRSSLHVALLGVLANPYDIAKPFRKNTSALGSSTPLQLLSPQLTNASRGGSSTPILSGGTSRPPPFHREDTNAAESLAQGSTMGDGSSENTDGGSFQTARRPLPGSDPEP